MGHRVHRPAGRIIVGLAAVVMVFGLAILMVVERYNAAVITSVVTGTSLAAAELVRRLQGSVPAEADRGRVPSERS